LIPKFLARDNPENLSTPTVIKNSTFIKKLIND